MATPARPSAGGLFRPPALAPRGGNRVRLVAPLLVLLCGVGAFTTVAQEGLRASLAGQMAMEAKKRRIASGWGNVRLGPVRLDLSTQLGIEASDNVRYWEKDPESDLIFTPGLTVRALYPVSDKNLVSLGAGISYYKYLQNGDLDYLGISPDTDLAFDIYAGDFAINFHDRFHYTAAVADQSSLSGLGRYGRFDNSLGALVVWDLNMVLLTFNYDHLIYAVTDSVYDYMDHTSELLSLRSAWLITPMTPVGVEVGFGTTDYDKDLLDDTIHYSAGVFYEMPAGRFSSLRAGAGYVLYEPTSNNNTNVTGGGSSGAFYADLSFEHRITQHITYRLSAGQQLQAGVYSQTLQLLYARAWVNWNIFRDYSLSTSFDYENGEESGSYYYWQLEKFDRFSAGVAVSKRLNESLSTSLGYYFMQRNSDVGGRNYSQNRLVLNVSYRF